MKATDYLAKFLLANDVDRVFGLQGGAVVHLFDSIECLDGMNVTYCHHEQAASLAAVAYSKRRGGLGCAIVTTGPACTNALTGLLAAWQDSTPVIFISGQTRIEHTSYGKRVRQVGSQEFAILDVVKPITKYAQLIESPQKLPEILKEAATAALSGRQGPVWIDFPVNLQWADIYGSSEIPKVQAGTDFLGQLGAEHIDALSREFTLAKRPLLVAGNGIRSARCTEAFISVVEQHKLPFVTSWTASDILPTDHPLNAGIIGVAGHRGANKAAFSADLLVCLGCHLGLTQTSTLTDTYAPNARKVIIDVDSDQLNNLTVQFDLSINANLLDFFSQSLNISFNIRSKTWLNSISTFKRMNSVESTLTDSLSLGDSETVNSNLFNFELTRRIPSSADIVVDGGGTALYTGFQSSFIKVGQRIICSSSISAMGTGLPEAVGVSQAKGSGEVYCIIGDGSLMLNLQELQTIRHHSLPIKIIVYNNNGYLAIKHTQESFLEKRYFGTDINNGLSFPDIEKIAICFGISYIKSVGIQMISEIIDKVITYKGPMLVEIITPEMQTMLFQQGYHKNIDGTFSPANLSEMKPYISISN